MPASLLPIRVAVVVLLALSACGTQDTGEASRAAGDPRSICVDDRLCTGDHCFAADDMISILACQCDRLDATCGLGACEADAYCEGRGCSDPACFPSDSDISAAMCAGRRPADCAPTVVVAPHCVGASLCENGECYPAADPISQAACTCGLLDPTCGLGQCIDGAYCEGSGCPHPVCYTPDSAISLAMCGGIPLTNCAIGCVPPSDEVALWSLDETRTTSAFMIEWNPDAQTGPAATTNRTTFREATQYLPPQRDVSAFAFSDDWSGAWTNTGFGGHALVVELFDAAAGPSGNWVTILSWQYYAPTSATLAGESVTFAPLGMVTAIRIKGYPLSQGGQPSNYFHLFGKGEMYLSGDAALRPKDVAARNNGTATDTVQYRTLTGPPGPTPAAGKVGGALAFDGVGDVVVAPLHYDDTNPGNRATHPYHQLTIDAWINATQLDATSRAILAFVGAEQPVLNYALSLVGGNLDFMAGFGSPLSQGSVISGATTGAPITAGTWHHVAVVNDSNTSTMRFYVDGNLAGTTTWSLQTISAGPRATDQWQIGSAALAGAPAASFHGRIDEVRVHERALAAGEIAAVYAAGTDGTCRRGLLMAVPHHGQVFEGANLGRTVPVSGYATVAGQAVAIEAYDTASASWTQLGTTIAASSLDPQTGLYLWSLNVTPVASASSTAHWRETGLGWLRVVAANGAFVGATVDDPLCLQANVAAGVTGAHLATNCRGDHGPMATLADSDSPSQQSPSMVPVFAKTEPGPTSINGLMTYLWKRLYVNGVGNSVTAGYYADVDAANGDHRDTSAGWKLVNGFPAGEVRAIYFNAGDLRIGRDMHCREVRACDGNAPLCTNQQCNVVIRTACYVTNYFEVAGPPAALTAYTIGPGGPAGVALDHAITGTDPKATVAMEALHHKQDPASCGSGTWLPPPAGNQVRFYAYDETSLSTTYNLVSAVKLDGEIPKPVPGACLACHGGQANAPMSATNPPWASSTKVYDASFIAFDVGSFFYPSVSPWTYGEQEDALRQLNAMVKATNPSSAIVDLIDGQYTQESTTGALLFDVDDPNIPANIDYAPRGWAGYEPTYERVPRRSCRTCHLSQSPDAQWLSFGKFASSGAPYAACPNPKPYMPQAEVPYKDLWRHGHRADLVDATMAFRHCAP